MPTEQQLMEVRGILLDLLLMNYTQMQPYAITRACHYLDHPMRPSGAMCVCKVKRGVVRPPLERT